MRRVPTIVLSCWLAACGTQRFTQTEETPRQSTSTVQWRELADGSYGWFHENEASVDAERCWKTSDQFGCVRIAKVMRPNEMQLGLGDLMIYGVVRRALATEQVLPEIGYRCAIMDQEAAGTVESITLGSGARMENSVSGPPGSGSWSGDYVRNFVAENDPSTPLVHFNCFAVRQFLEGANEAAFLTTGMNRKTLALQ
jgi:hypothetical protein